MGRRTEPVGWRVLELFSGLGGWRYALPAGATVAAAYDISPAALDTYALNHGHRPRAKELATVAASELIRAEADTWVLSPPCQPFCRMGKKGDLEDPRSRAFLRVLDLLEVLRPRRMVLENVPGFTGSEAHQRLTALLDRLGYEHRTLTLCPTRLGIPNQRPRAYVVASQEGLASPELPVAHPGPLAPCLDPVEDPSLYLRPEVLAKHLPGLDLVTAADTRSACFIGGYGQRYVGSGSFLRTARGIRRFSPAEIARLHGLPGDFRFPEDLPLQSRYKLLGNGLSIPAARWVLLHLR